jgi:hypothetical protein
MKTILAFFPLAIASALFACGTTVTEQNGAGGASGASTGAGPATSTGTGPSTTSGATTSSSSTSSTGAGGGGGGRNSGDCNTDADCSGGTCVELTPGGFRTCEHTPQEATTCMPPDMDQCCDSAQCPMGGKCFYVHGSCGGPAMVPGNQCENDQCHTDADCLPEDPSAVGICAPAGTFGFDVRTCLVGSCKLDRDCKAEAGGKCEPIADPCCGAYARGLFCVYPDGCRTNNDCPGGYCEADVQSGRGVCKPGSPPCPV